MFSFSSLTATIRENGTTASDIACVRLAAPFLPKAGALYRAGRPGNRPGGRGDMSETQAKPYPAAAMIRRWPLAVLFVLCFAAWLPGFFTIPPLDRDESRFAQASKQMLETHNFVDIRFGVEPRYKKPVGIYWLQAASTAVVSAVTGDERRDHIWTYRIPSLLGAFAAVALTFWCASAFLSAEGAFLSALLLGLTLASVRGIQDRQDRCGPSGHGHRQRRACCCAPISRAIPTIRRSRESSPCSDGCRSPSAF